MSNHTNISLRGRDLGLVAVHIRHYALDYGSHFADVPFDQLDKVVDTIRNVGLYYDGQTVDEYTLETQLVVQHGHWIMEVVLCD